MHGCPPTPTSHARRPPSANGSLPRSLGGEHGAAREFSIPRFWRARGTTTGVIVDTVRARSACGRAQPAIANRQYRHRRSGGEAAEASETGRNRAAIGPYCSPGRERSIYSTFMMPVGDGQRRALSSSRLGPASGQDLVSQLHKCALSASRGPFNAPNEVLYAPRVLDYLRGGRRRNLRSFYGPKVRSRACEVMEIFGAAAERRRVG